MSRRHRHRTRNCPQAWQIAAFGVVVAVLLMFALTGWRHQQADRHGMERRDATLPVAVYPSTTLMTNTVAYQQPTVPVTFRSGQPLRVLFVGDSISYGELATSRNRSFPALVTDWLKRHGPVDATVKAVPGVKTSYWQPNALLPDQDIIVVELGTNDFNKTDPVHVAAAYRQLVAGIMRESPRAQMICLSPWQDVTDTAQADPYGDAVSNSCRGLYLDIGGIYADPANRGSDNFHPDDAGHAAIAEEVEAAIHIR